MSKLLWALCLIFLALAPPVAAQENAVAPIFADLRSFLEVLLGWPGSNDIDDGPSLEALPAEDGLSIVPNGGPGATVQLEGEEPEYGPMVIVDG